MFDLRDEVLPERQVFATELARVTAALAVSRTVLITGGPLDGLEKLERLLQGSLPWNRVVSGAGRDHEEALTACLAEPSPAPLIVAHAESLCDVSAETVLAAAEERRLPIVLFAETEGFAPGAFSEALRRGALEWVELGRRPWAELRHTARRAAGGRLDGAALEEALWLSDGRLALVESLVSDALEAGEWLPSYRPWHEPVPPTFGKRTLALADTWCERLPRDVGEGLTTLAGLGALPLTVLPAWLGSRTTSRLLGSGSLRRFFEGGEEHVAVSPVFASALHHRFGSLRDDAGARDVDRLVELWRRGYAVGDAASLVLTRRLTLGTTAPDPQDASRVIRAARLLNQLGRPREALVFADAVDGGEAAEPATNTGAVSVRLAALVALGRHREALALARETAGEHPECLGEAAFLYATAIAVSRVPEAGDWWRSVTGAGTGGHGPTRAPVTLGLLGGCLGTERGTLAALEAEAHDGDADVCLRLLAAVLYTVECLLRSDTESLPAVLVTGRRLAKTLSQLGPEESPLLAEVCLSLFYGVASIASALTGPKDRNGEEFERLLFEVVTGPHVRGTWEGGVLAAVNGQLRRRLSAPRGRTMRVGRAVKELAVASLPLSLGGLLAFALGLSTQRPAWATSVGGAVEEPSWCAVMRAYQCYLNGEERAVEAVRSLPAVSGAPFAHEVLMRDHLRASAESNPKKLLSLAPRLGAMSMAEAQRLALEEALTLFIEARNVHGARAARDLLWGGDAGPFPDAALAPERGPLLGALTRREREVVGLIGESLTGRQIAERMGISVRTVESHIYAARRKLGARHKNDLPGLVIGNHHR